MVKFVDDGSSFMSFRCAFF